MESSDPTNARPGLRQPFIETANALAGLYKQAISAERDARDAGSRAAYMRVMQWAARKSRAGDRLTVQDIVNFCASELAQVPGAQGGQVALVAKQPHGEKGEAEGGGIPGAKVDAPPVAYVPRDEALVSDIKKLNVNPKKRQRVDISDTFVSACRSNDTLIFEDHSHGHARSPDSSMSPVFFEMGPPNRPPSSPSPRRDPREHNRDRERDRDTPFISMASGDYPGRKGKNPKAQIYDKLRRK